MKPTIDIIVAAAGSSRRMGKAAAVNKPYLTLAGRPVLAHSLLFFEHLPVVGQIVIAAGAEEVDFCREQVVEPLNLKKVSAIVPGGAERQDSIYNGLQALQASGRAADWVAVHDSARPFLSDVLFMVLFRMAQQFGAAVPGVLVKDTIKSVTAEGWVESTPPRAQLRAIQTPQLFDFRKLLAAYEQAKAEGLSATDDAMMYEKYVGRVRVVDTTWDNLKITTPEDWAWARYRAEELRL